MAEASLNVYQTVMLVGWRAERLGQQLVARDAQRQLSAAGAQCCAIDADQVPEVEVQQRLHPVGPKLVDSRLQLNPPGAVHEVKERHLPLTAPRGESPGDAVRGRRLLPGLERLMGSTDRADRLGRVELVRERLDAGVAQAIELLTPRGEDVLVLFAGAHGRCALRRLRSS